ncbi:MAG: hypothetical protein ACOYU3_01260 [Bacillota bacterium]
MKNTYDELEKEREKLNNLVNEAIKNGVHISQNEVILAQSRKVDALIYQLQKERERLSKK